MNTHHFERIGLIMTAVFSMTSLAQGAEVQKNSDAIVQLMRSKPFRNIVRHNHDKRLTTVEFGNGRNEFYLGFVLKKSRRRFRVRFNLSVLKKADLDCNLIEPDSQSAEIDSLWLTQLLNSSIIKEEEGSMGKGSRVLKRIEITQNVLNLSDRDSQEGQSMRTLTRVYVGDPQIDWAIFPNPLTVISAIPGNAVQDLPVLEVESCREMANSLLTPNKD